MTPLTNAGWAAASDGPRLELTRRLRQPIEQVWQAIATPARISAWMGVEWLGDQAPLRLGSRFDYRFANSGMESLGEVLAFDPPFLLEHSWHANTPPAAIVRWALAPDGDGCVLTLTQTAGPPEDGPRNAAGWTFLVENLAVALGEPDDFVRGGMEAWRGCRDRYALAFPPRANRDGRRMEVDGETALRFERRLAKSPSVVWDALVKPEALGRWLQAEEAVIDGRVGGRFHLVLGGGSSRMAGEILRWEPPRVLEYSWPETVAHADSHVRFEVFEDGAGSRLVLTHWVGDDRDVTDFASGWHWHLDALEPALDGSAVAFDEPRWRNLKKAYELTL